MAGPEPEEGEAEAEDDADEDEASEDDALDADGFCPESDGHKLLLLDSQPTRSKPLASTRSVFLESII
jgi:hypothetical protein